MTVDQPVRVFRVTVRGRFSELSDVAHRYLVDTAAEHDIFRSAYTPEGTLTYDDQIVFFNMRFERRAGDGAAAAAEGLAEAEQFMRTMRFGYRDLRVDTVDMSAMWDDVARDRTD